MNNNKTFENVSNNYFILRLCNIVFTVQSFFNQKYLRIRIIKFKLIFLQLLEPCKTHTPGYKGSVPMLKADFKPTNILGKGSFGKVLKATEKQTKKEFAIKIIEKVHIKKLKMVEQLKNEIKILQMVEHDNIVKMYAYFEVRILVNY